MNGQKERNLNLDLAKIIACLCVIGYHSEQITDHAYLSYHAVFTMLCFAGVPLFMMAAGYLIFNRAELSAQYAARKIFGCLRFSFLWTCVIAVYSFLGNRSFHLSDFAAFAKLPNVTLHALMEEAEGTPFSVLWFMGALMLLYGFGWVYYRYKFNKLRAWLTALAIGCALQAASYVCRRPLQQAVTLTFRLWTWIQFALLGALMPEIVRWMQKRVLLWTHIAALAIVAVGYTLFWKVLSDRWFGQRLSEQFYDSLVLILLIALAFSLVMRLKIGRAVAGFVRTFAPLTAGIYPIHIMVLLTWSKYGLLPGVPSVIPGAVISFALAWLVYRIKPARQLFKI